MERDGSGCASGHVVWPSKQSSGSYRYFLPTGRGYTYEYVLMYVYMIHGGGIGHGTKEGGEGEWRGVGREEGKEGGKEEGMRTVSRHSW